MVMNSSVRLCGLVLERFAPKSLMVITSRSMYENPYTARYKPKKPPSPTFHKETTGLTGLFVNEFPHRELTKEYGRILRVLQAMPENAAYRKFTEKVISRRLALVNEEKDIQKLENKIGMGQIEEVIEQAQMELATAKAILKSKAWEPLVEKAPEGQWAWPIA